MTRGGECSQTPVDEEGLWVPKTPAPPPRENASPPPWTPALTAEMRGNPRGPSKSGRRGVCLHLELLEETSRL